MAAQTRTQSKSATPKVGAGAPEPPATPEAPAESAPTVKRSSFVVRVNGFVARTSKDKPSQTHRYSEGEKFVPVDGVHDTDELVALGYIGKYTGKDDDSGVSRISALALAQRAARYHEESSPVLDLTAQPFEMAAPADASE